MHAAAIYVVEAHLAELQKEAAARRIAQKPRGSSPIARLIASVRATFAEPSEPFLPRLEAYPYSK